jgi:hypothetical protein
VFTVVPSLTAHVGPLAPFPARDLVDLVDEDDPRLLHAVDRGAGDALHVDQLLLFFLRQRVERVGNAQPPLLHASLEEAREHVLHVDVDLLDRGARDDLEGREALLADVDFDVLVIEAAVAELLAQLFPRALRLLADRRRLLVVLGGGGKRRQQQIEHTFLGRLARLLAHLGGPLLLDHIDTELHEVAHHGLHVAADVPHLGELRRLHLEERRLRQPRQPPREFGLPHAGRADHQDILRRDLLGDVGRQLLPAHAVAQRNRHRALRGRLADNVLVELDDNLARGQRFGGGRRGLGQVDGHPLQGFDRDGRVRIDADRGSDLHGLGGNLVRTQLGVPRERLGRRHRIRASRSNRDDPIVWFDEVAVAGQQVRLPGVHDDEHRLQPAEEAVRPPVLCELDGRSIEVAPILFELCLEAREEGEGVGGRTGKARQDAIVVKAPDFASRLLDDGVAKGDLAIAGHDGAVAVADGKDCRGAEHSGSLLGVYQSRDSGLEIRCPGLPGASLREDNLGREKDSRLSRNGVL